MLLNHKESQADLIVFRTSNGCSVTVLVIGMVLNNFSSRSTYIKQLILRLTNIQLRLQWYSNSTVKFIDRIIEMINNNLYIEK